MIVLRVARDDARVEILTHFSKIALSVKISEVVVVVHVVIVGVAARVVEVPTVVVVVVVRASLAGCGTSGERDHSTGGEHERGMADDGASSRCSHRGRAPRDAKGALAMPGACRPCHGRVTVPWWALGHGCLHFT